MARAPVAPGGDAARSGGAGAAEAPIRARTTRTGGGAVGRPSKNRPDRAAPGGNGARAAAPGYAGAGAAARIRRAVRAFAYDDLSAPACVLLSIAFILSGISHAAQSTLLDGHGAFPTAGDNLPMAALYVLLFGAAWAFPERAESLARSRSGRAAVCLSALAGAAGLVLAGPLAAAGSGWAAAAGHAGSLLTRVAGALLMLVCAGLTVYRGLSWSACLACTALLGAVACDLLVLLLSADGAAVLVLCLPVVAWVLLARVQRERRGDRIGRGAEHLHVQRVRGHSFALEVALFGMYGLAGGMSSGQSFTIAGTPGPSSPALPQSLVNDLGLVLGVAVVALGVAALLARRVSPMPLRAVALPSYTACLFLAPLSADGSGVFVPVLVSLTQSLLYALLWLVPHVTDTARPLRGFAASCCAFLGCSFVGMWVGGELLPSALPGDVFMAGAVVLVCAIFVVEVLPPLFGPLGQGVGAQADAGRSDSSRVGRSWPDLAGDKIRAGEEVGPGEPGGATHAGGAVAGVGAVFPSPGAGPLPAGTGEVGAAMAVLPGQRAFDTAVAEATGCWGLTPRESVVLPGLVRGRNMARIAAELVVSKNTVHTHVRNIYAKADVHSQEQLMDAFEEILGRVGGGAGAAGA